MLPRVDKKPTWDIPEVRSASSQLDRPCIPPTCTPSEVSPSPPPQWPKEQFYWLKHWLLRSKSFVLTHLHRLQRASPGIPPGRPAAPQRATFATTVLLYILILRALPIIIDMISGNWPSPLPGVSGLHTLPKDAAVSEEIWIHRWTLPLLMRVGVGLTHIWDAVHMYSDSYRWGCRNKTSRRPSLSKAPILILHRSNDQGPSNRPLTRIPIISFPSSTSLACAPAKSINSFLFFLAWLLHCPGLFDARNAFDQTRRVGQGERVVKDRGQLNGETSSESRFSRSEGVRDAFYEHVHV